MAPLRGAGTVNVIDLNTVDTVPRSAMNQAGQQTTNFRTPPHEFGHTMLSGGRVPNPDEYRSTSPNIADTSSIMNIGREVRKRHLAEVIAELNKLVPDLTFSVAFPIQ